MSATTVGLTGAAATIIGALIAGFTSYAAGKKAARDQFVNDIKVRRYEQSSQRLEDIRDNIRGCLTTYVLDQAIYHHVAYLDNLQKASEDASKQLVVEGLETKNSQLESLGHQLDSLMRDYIAMTKELEAGQVTRDAVDTRRKSVRDESANIIRQADDILSGSALA